MRRFETFNPSIPEDSERTNGESLPVFEATQSGKATSYASKSTVKPRKVNKTKSNKKDKKESESNFSKRFVEFFTSKSFKWIVGLIFAFFAIYLSIAFISYFTSSVEDQAEITNTSIGRAGEVSNAAGEGGARLAEFLINEFFGLGSLVIIVWLLAIGLRLITGKPHFKTVNFTIKCLVAFITISLVVGLLTIGMQSAVNWGGYHGRYVNEFIIHFLGWSGAVLLCLLMICIFVIICLRDVVKWILLQKSKFDEKRRIRRQQLEEQRAKEKELEEMRKAEDQAEHPDSEDKYKPKEEESIPEVPAEVSFDLSENGLYSEIPSLELENITYNFEDKAVNEESLNENKPDSIYQYEFKEEDLEEGTKSENQEDISENIGEDAGKVDIEPEKNNLPSETESQNNEITDDISMVVNVNSISQVKGKSVGIGEKMPGRFPYKFPPYEILVEGQSKVSVDDEEQLANKEKIRSTLLDFDIPIVSIEATVGPTVTLYEIVPDKGIRVSKIRSLVDDIALSLSAEGGVRIIAPIPGKGTVGIEVANKVKQTVSMRTVLKSSTFHETKAKLPIALGSKISNEVFVADLAKMPHLLVAGATGQGKSVGLNAIIASLLYSKRPDELKFVMIDPKMVEFSLYAKIEGHYLAKIPDAEESIITEMDKVVATLSSLCIEMDNRYQLLKEASTRNIIEYNEKFKEHKLNPNDGHRYLPYIVVIVDEFSDLIMTAGKEVEIPIARLAQKARAVGMHVIIATQRPSTNVITGIIKANFPSRIAFKVSSMVDSKTILDTTGAQQLIGRGDMLVSNNGPMTRVQCAFIDTPEVEKLCEHIAAQPYAQGAYLLPEPLAGKGDLDGAESNGGASSAGERDPLFEEVARLVVQTNNASTSSIQRRYRIGYNRAGSIMDQLEASGIVGPAQGGKPRSVLMDPVSLDLLLENL